MVNIKDIYPIIDIQLMKEDYWSLDIEDKKKLIDKTLKEYIIFKINEINSNVLCETNKDMNTVELFELLSSLIPKEEHFETIRHFTHYILQISSNLQGWSIIWWGEEKEELVENPLVEFDIDGKWNKLVTDDRTDLVKAFKFAYHIFMNEFMVIKKDSIKRLQLGLKEIESE